MLVLSVGSEGKNIINALPTLLFEEVTERCFAIPVSDQLDYI
jgi:hypothetical protein